MSQRTSGYARIDGDLYETPAWVTAAVIPHLDPLPGLVWEPAAGGGKIVKELQRHGIRVVATDISTGADFFEHKPVSAPCILTNPPYSVAQRFIEHALALCPEGLVVMLLRTDFDHAKRRVHLFMDNRRFRKKVILTKRIVWFERPGAAPSFNHAWYIWGPGEGPPVLAYEGGERAP
ncbi:MAG: hypothetical protein ACO35B_06435 [Luminiphilus sp.]